MMPYLNSWLFTNFKRKRDVFVQVARKVDYRFGLQHLLSEAANIVVAMICWSRDTSVRMAHQFRHRKVREHLKLILKSYIIDCTRAGEHVVFNPRIHGPGSSHNENTGVVGEPPIAPPIYSKDICQKKTVMIAKNTCKWQLVSLLASVIINLKTFMTYLP